MFHFLSKQPPARQILLSFALVILVGSLLLNLPFFQMNVTKASYLDHFFTSVSMVCVTGLSTQSVADTYNVWGQLICMLLIQVGGLGLISFIGLIYIQSKQKLSAANRITIQESLSHSESHSIKDFLKSVFLITFAFELLGTILLCFRFIPLFGWKRGLFNSLFSSISAFCNAGFDNIGNTSLLAYQTDVWINLTITSLIIMGGLGFSVWFDLRTNIRPKDRKRNLRFHTKVVIGLTLSILFLGTLLTLLTEYSNPNTIGKLPLNKKMLTTFFQVVSMRTAGFSTIDYTKARPITLLLYVFQMFFGGAPGGTAGGIKITTLLILLTFSKSEILGLPYVNFRSHTFVPSTIRKAFSVFVVFTSIFLVGLMFLVLMEPDKPLIYLIFETMSALATVGVTANLTTTLSPISLGIIMILMFIGRIGPLTLLISLSDHQPDKRHLLRYSKANIIVG